MKDQLFVGELPRQDLMLPVRNSGSIKPHGGLWTSTLNEKGISDWIRWCQSESFGDSSKRVYKLEVNHSAKILEINGPKDLGKLAWKPHTHVTGHEYVNFEELAQEWDAVHLTEEGQWSTRLIFPRSLYGWDCESTIWFNWCFGMVELHAISVDILCQLT